MTSTDLLLLLPCCFTKEPFLNDTHACKPSPQRLLWETLRYSAKEIFLFGLLSIFFLLPLLFFLPPLLFLKLTWHPSSIYSGPHIIHDLCHLGLEWFFSTLAAGRVLLQLLLWQEECSFCVEFNMKSASLLGRSHGLYNTPCFTLLNICSGWAAALVFNVFPLSIYFYLSVTHITKNTWIIKKQSWKMNVTK